MVRPPLSEILPTANDLCAFNCPTVAAVHDAHEILYCEEVLKTPDGSTQKLGVAVIPLLSMSGDEARAVLLMRPKKDDSEEKLLSTARKFRADLLTRFQHH